MIYNTYPGEKNLIMYIINSTLCDVLFTSDIAMLKCMQIKVSMAHILL